MNNWWNQMFEEMGWYELPLENVKMEDTRSKELEEGTQECGLGPTSSSKSNKPNKT